MCKSLHQQRQSENPYETMRRQSLQRSYTHQAQKKTNEVDGMRRYCNEKFKIYRQNKEKNCNGKIFEFNETF